MNLLENDIFDPLAEDQKPDPPPPPPPTTQGWTLSESRFEKTRIALNPMNPLCRPREVPGTPTRTPTTRSGRTGPSRGSRGQTRQPNNGAAAAAKPPSCQRRKCCRTNTSRISSENEYLDILHCSFLFAKSIQQASEGSLKSVIDPQRNAIYLLSSVRQLFRQVMNFAPF